MARPSCLITVLRFQVRRLKTSQSERSLIGFMSSKTSQEHPRSATNMQTDWSPKSKVTVKRSLELQKVQIPEETTVETM